MAWDDAASGGLGVDTSSWGSGALPASAWNTTGSSGGIDYSKLAQGLKAVSDASAAGPQKPAVANLAPGANAATGQAASAAYSGNPAAMNALVQMLMQRVQALRDASNPATARPVNLGGGSRPSGLLGL
jgi:hypothetical protein